MAKNAVTDWDENPNLNTDIGGTNIDEGCAPSGMNNAVRTVMSQVRTFFRSSLFRLRDSTDQTKLLAFDLSGLSSGTQTLTAPNASGVIGLAGAVDAKSADYTVTAQDAGKVISVSASGGNRVIILPSSGVPPGFPVVIKKIDSSTNYVQVDPASSLTIDGALNRLLRQQYESIAVVFDGTNYQIMSNGAVFSEGTGANGSWIRFAGGTQKVWNKFTTPITTNAAAGSVFTAAATTAVTYEKAFVSAPALVPGAHRDVTGNAGSVWAGCAANVGSPTTGGSIILFGATNTAVGGLAYEANGLWY